MSELDLLLTKFKLSRASLEQEQCSKDLFQTLIQEIPSFEDAVLFFDFTPSEINGLRSDSKTEKARRHDMLWKWKDKNGSDATILAIVKIFLKMKNKSLAELILERYSAKGSLNPHLSPVSAQNREDTSEKELNCPDVLDGED